MIKSFKCKRTEKLFKKNYVKQFSGFARQAEKRLQILNSAEVLTDLEALPSNRFEKLAGGRLGEYSISINMQWRIFFSWDDAPYHVEVVDYH